MKPASTRRRIPVSGGAWRWSRCRRLLISPDFFNYVEFLSSNTAFIFLELFEKHADLCKCHFLVDKTEVLAFSNPDKAQAAADFLENIGHLVTDVPKMKASSELVDAPRSRLENIQSLFLNAKDFISRRIRSEESTVRLSWSKTFQKF